MNRHHRSTPGPIPWPAEAADTTRAATARTARVHLYKPAASREDG
jgi:hypothetical protein